MQIHEITRRRTNESILKGVANKAPAPAAAPAAKPTTMQKVGGGMLNAAELASKAALDKLGVPDWAQGGSWQGGHVAALQRRSTAHINSQEERVAAKIANKMHQKWIQQGRSGPIPLVDNDILAQATEEHNTSRSSELPIDLEKVVASVKKRTADILAAEKADTIERARKQHEVENEIVRLKGQLDQGGLSPEQAEQMKKDITIRMGVLQSLGGREALDRLTSLMTTTGAQKPAAIDPSLPAVKPGSRDAEMIQAIQTPGKASVNTGGPNPNDPRLKESLSWSKNFDPSKELYRRMKQGQTQ